MKGKKNFFILVGIVIAVLMIVFVSTQLNQDSKTNNNESSKILVLNNITNQITMDELFEIELSKEYTTEARNIKVENNHEKEDFLITYTNTSFYGSRCIKEYYFTDEKLEMLIYSIDKSHYMPKDILEELIVLNGDADDVDIKSDELGRDTYTWYGKNGTIIFSDDNVSNILEVVFEIKE